jgi:alkanesulfonate monooxygenase SsuD/methylene tetrahydromethanopterin reductase-like flavin-dependent oxidoreductase (luciferase family)
MDIGIGLPVTVPGTPPEDLMAWGRLAEDAGFASVATLDRIAYPNYDPLIALAATAAVTRRIKLATTVLLGPARGAGPVLVKQIASLHRLSGQRLVLGLAVGARPNDYEVAGEPFGRRGRRIEDLVALLHAAGAPATARVPDGAGVPTTAGAMSPPMPDGGPPLLLGGHSDAAIARAARLATGWISGGSSGQPYQERADRVRKAWAAAGRDAEPRLIALLYFALGPAAPARIERTLGAFYAGTGPYGARAIAEALSTPAAIADAVAEHADAGCHELIFMPCASSVDQVDRLRAALR